jgi:peptidoglycan/LPS O-acetylase OafA/YrhL
VIFFLLDREPTNYRVFIVRRALRLWPLMLVTLAAAIPISLLRAWNVEHATAFVDPGLASTPLTEIHNWWSHVPANVLLHVTLLHGLVPDAIIPNAPGAFLEPAWSVSLEWQFYLVAPFLYAACVSGKRSRLFAVCAGTFACVLLSRRVLPEVQYGAALPFYAEYFFFGAVSYFLYRKYAGSGRSTALVVMVTSLLVFRLGQKTDDLLPLCIWALVLSSALEAPDSVVARRLLPLFDNRITQYLGRISYSLYLSHFLVLAVVQYALLRYLPALDRPMHVAWLLCGTVPLVIGISALLYRYVELPGIRAGRALARSPVLLAGDAASSDQFSARSLPRRADRA